MKKIVFYILILSLSLWARPQWIDSYEEAQERAFKDKKLIMLMLSRENCQACWYMEHIVFVNKKVKALIEDNFVPVYLDINSDFIPDGFSYIGTPTFYFTDAKGKKVSERLDGGANAKDFTQKLTEVLSTN